MTHSPTDVGCLLPKLAISALQSRVAYLLMLAKLAVCRGAVVVELGIEGLVAGVHGEAGGVGIDRVLVPARLEGIITCHAM
jgi:hypothetical protein